MTQKPSYKELEQRIKALEKEAGARGQAEEALRESEEKYSTLVENSLTGIFIHQDGKYVFVNNRFADIHDYQPEELVGQDPLTLIHPDEREALRQVLSKRLKRESAPSRYEVRRLRKDGKTIWCEMMATRIEYARRPAIMGNVIDITERKRAQEALRESEEKYREVVERANDGIAIIQDGLLKYVNSSLAEMTGYTVEGGIDTPFTNYVCPDEVSEAVEDYKRRMSGEPLPARYERALRHKNGSRIDAEISGGVITYQNRPADLIIIRDISERKQVEEALQERESSYRTLAENLPGIVYRVFIRQNNRMHFFNNMLDVTTGYTFEELKHGKVCSLEHFIVPEDRADVISTVRNAIIEDKPFEVEYRLRRKDGNIRHLSERGRPTRGTDGKPLHIDGVIFDVTDRKQAEEALLESSRRLQVAYEQAITYAQELKNEITEHRRAEEALRQRKEKLKAQARNLEEMNTALKVLLEQREQDKTELEERVLSNVKELVLPYVEMIGNTRLDPSQKGYVSVIESNLHDIVSPFLRALSSKYLSFTPREIQIADLVKLGKTTKEIAELLHLSIRTIEFHRENIRAKFGLKNQPANLRSFLLSLSRERSD